MPWGSVDVCRGAMSMRALGLFLVTPTDRPALHSQTKTYAVRPLCDD